jgi:hypothetical protein
MLNIPTHELLLLWGELVEAYHGVNGYGSDTADLYAYRFMRHQPTAVMVPAPEPGGMMAQIMDDAHKQAAWSLFALLVHFREFYGCTIEVDGRRLGKWLAAAPFTHRVHVKVIRNGGRHAL